jgi:NADPH-dependent ferric siderophore reductase
MSQAEDWRQSEGPIERHAFRKVRHETRRRDLTVHAVEALTPGMRRIVLSSPELSDFVSAAPDDHVKLMLDDGAGGLAMRDYTPRAFDTASGRLTIDFALHDAGAATNWAINAKVGDRLTIGGPRGSTVIPDNFDWYLFIGDETGLPAIGRWVEELRPGVPVTTVVALDRPDDAQHLETRADWNAHWVVRAVPGTDDTEALVAALDRLIPAAGEGLIWIAAEARAAKALRARAADHHGHPLKWIKAKGYWVRGSPGETENL